MFEIVNSSVVNRATGPSSEGFLPNSGLGVGGWLSMEIVLRKGADLVALRLLQDRTGMGTAVGRRAWVAGELSSGLGSGVGF